MREDRRSICALAAVLAGALLLAFPAHTAEPPRDASAATADQNRPEATRAPSGATQTSPGLSREALRQRPRILTTKLQIVEGSGEFEFLKDEVVVTEQGPVKLQWTTTRTDAVGGEWTVRNKAAPDVIVASGKDAPAPAPDKMRRFTIPAGAFLSASPPSTDQIFEIAIQALNSADAPAGGVSNTVTVKQLSAANMPAPTVFGDGAKFPSVELVSLEEHVGQVRLTQIYSTYADLKVRVRNGSNEATDPMFLKINDASLLYRQTAGPVELPSLAPNASTTVDIRVEAVLPPAQSQTPQAAQVSSWRQAYDDRCGPEFRTVLDWRGPQSMTPIDAHRESLLPLEGWADYTKVPPSVPICSGGQCVRICDIEKSIRSRLDGRVVGYSYVIGGGAPKFGAGGYARTAADGAAIEFTTKTPITIASVSKWITALGVMSTVRRRRGASIDDAAGAFYPDEWNVGNYFQNVTLSQFLSQQSGVKDYGNVKLDYAKLRSFFEQPVTNAWMANCTGSSVQDPPNAVNPGQAMTRCYSNYNFAIFRTLLPAIAGRPADPNLTTRPATLANEYELIVRQNVFERVGQTGTGCRPRGDRPHAFAYKFPGDAPGFDWGDVRDQCGGAGWYVSAEDMAKVLFSINAKDGKILRETSAASDLDIMRQRGLGLDTFGNQELSKNGAWGGGGALITSGAAIFGPVSGPNVVGVLFVNSEISGGPNDGENVLNVLRDAYNASVTPQ